MSRESSRMIIEQRRKKVRILEKELKDIQKAQSELGYIVLDKPLRDGWFRSIKLRDDIQKNKHANLFQEILDAIKYEVWGREKKYAERQWKRYLKRDRYYCDPPGLRYLDDREFLKLSPKAGRWFFKYRFKSYQGYRYMYACALPRYYFQVYYRRAYITKYRITSPIYESREQEIMEFLSRSELRRYSNYYSGNYGWYYNESKSLRRRMNMALSNLDPVFMDDHPS